MTLKDLEFEAQDGHFGWDEDLEICIIEIVIEVQGGLSKAEPGGTLTFKPQT